MAAEHIIVEWNTRDLAPVEPVHHHQCIRKHGNVVMASVTPSA